MKKLLFVLMLLGTEFGLGAVSPLIDCTNSPAHLGSLKFYYSPEDVGFEEPVASLQYQFGTAFLQCYFNSSPGDLGSCFGSWSFAMPGRIHVDFVRGTGTSGIAAVISGEYAGNEFTSVVECK